MILKDTKANFQLDNPILEAGDFGIETDTGKTKIGDGITAWNDLPYSNLIITTASEFRTSNPILALGIMGIEIDTNKSKVGDGITAWNDLPYLNIATAARHNLLQARLNQILGKGAGKSGYGQGITGYGPSLASYQVSNLPDSNRNIISANDVNSLYADMVRARFHQTGAAPVSIAEISTEENTIAENTSSIVTDNGINPDSEGSKKGIIDYENLMDDIELDKFQMHSSQSITDLAVSSTRSIPWNGIIFHEFTISFNDEDHRRHFFNSGGEIRIASSINGPVSTKGQDWENFLEDIGKVRINYNSTVNDGSIENEITTSLGNYELTGAYEVIYEGLSKGNIDPIYQNNRYRIYARFTSPSEIQFKAEYNDVSTGNILDINVDGILTNTVEIYRAGSIYVSVPSPISVTNIGLATFATPEPIYSLSASSPAVAEGDSVTINLTTVNVPNGQLVPYNIQDVTSADISGASLSGNFQVLNNSASIVINVANDLLLEGNDTEVMTVNLINGSSSVSVNIIDTTPDPIYSLTASDTAVYEGFSVTFDLNVQNLPSNSQIPYTISGITSADIDGEPLVGNFTIDANGEDSLTLLLTLDDFEESEILTLSLDNTVISASVDILDASYTLLSSNSSPKEGDTINITLITDTVPDGTVIPYTISGVSASDIDIALTGSFTVQQNTDQISVKFASDAVIDPDEQFTLSLDNNRASITLTITDDPLPTSANRTCIAIIDESSTGGYDPSAALLSANWTNFRNNWPDRPFYLLQPNIELNGTRKYSPSAINMLRVPSAYQSDPIAYGPTEVRRDYGNTTAVSDWYTLCNLDQLPDGSDLALFIDTSGSMTLDTVRASYNLFDQKIKARNMNIIRVFNGNENWILPFNTILDP